MTWRFVGRRLAQFVPVLILASIGVWGMIYLIPGSPATAIAGPNATQAQVHALSVRLGLDRSVPAQYWTWLTHAVRGDFGVSATSGQSVASLIGHRLPATLQLAVFSMIVALAISLPLGILAGSQSAWWIRRPVDIYQSVTLAVPTFWFGIILILVFGIYLGVLPTSSDFYPFWHSPVEAIRNTILPALTLGVYVSGILTRFLRATLAEELGEGYVTLARSKGVREASVTLKHALRNALIPFVTITGLQLGGFVGGTLVTEAVFNYPGLGRLIYNSVESRDYAVVQAATLLVAVTFMLVNLGVDLMYRSLDPRIRIG